MMPSHATLPLSQIIYLLAKDATLKTLSKWHTCPHDWAAYDCAYCKPL